MFWATLQIALQRSIWLIHFKWVDACTISCEIVQNWGFSHHYCCSLLLVIKTNTEKFCTPSIMQCTGVSIWKWWKSNDISTIPVHIWPQNLMQLEHILAYQTKGKKSRVCEKAIYFWSFWNATPCIQECQINSFLNFLLLVLSS